MDLTVAARTLSIPQAGTKIDLLDKVIDDVGLFLGYEAQLTGYESIEGYPGGQYCELLEDSESADRVLVEYLAIPNQS